MGLKLGVEGGRGEGNIMTSISPVSPFSAIKLMRDSCLLEHAFEAIVWHHFSPPTEAFLLGGEGETTAVVGSVGSGAKLLSFKLGLPVGSWVSYFTSACFSFFLSKEWV